jgi:hypothetical protein
VLASRSSEEVSTYRDIDPSFLDLAGTTVSDKPIGLERDQTKRDYLHPIVGSEAAKIGAGLFTT